MNRQIQIGGVFFNLSTTREYQVSGLYVNEEDAAGGGGGLSIPIAMRHYMQLMGA